MIEALTETDRPRKYWSDLKAKLKKEGSTIKLISLIRSSFFVEVLYFFHTYYMLTLTNDLQIISQGACVGLQLKPLQFVTILRCWLKMNMEAVDAVESVFSKL